MYLFSVIFISAYICFSDGLVLNKGCPHVEPVDNFNLNASLGIWYEIARYPNEWEKTNCGKYEFIPSGEKVKAYLVDTFNVTERLSDHVETTFEADPEAEGKGIVIEEITFGYPPVSTRLREYILAMDCDKFYITYECQYNEETKEIDEYAWIMTRFKDFSSELKEVIDNFIITSNVLKASKFIWLDKSC